MKLRSFLRYLDLRWFRGLAVRPTRPIRKRQVPLSLETLERRDVFSVTRPTILAVTPNKVLLITYWGSPSGTKNKAKEIGDILGSVKSLVMK